MGYFRAMRIKHGSNIRNHLNQGTQQPHRQYIFCCKSDPRPTTTQKPTTQQPVISRSELACQKYQRIEQNFSNKFKKCQGKNINNGENTNVNEFPHMAAIGYEKEGSLTYDFDCGGSLISEKFVLTAAHCVNRRNQVPKIVRLGKVIEAYSL